MEKNLVANENKGQNMNNENKTSYNSIPLFDFLKNKGYEDLYKKNNGLLTLENVPSNKQSSFNLFEEKIMALVEESYPKEKKLYRALSLKHPLKKSSTKDGVKLSFNNKDGKALIDYLTKLDYKEIIDYMSSKEYIDKIYKKSESQGIRIALRDDAGTYKQTHSKGKREKDDFINIVRTALEKELTNEVISEIQTIIDKTTDDEFTNFVNAQATIVKDKISIQLKKGSYLSITIPNSQDIKSIDAFATLRVNSENTNIAAIIDTIIKILYEPLETKFGKEGIYKSFFNKTYRILRRLLIISYKKYIETNKQDLNSTESIQGFIKKYFPQNSSGIQGTLGEQLGVTLLKNKNKNIKYKILGQNRNSLDQEGHIDMLVTIDNEKIGIQAKQFNSQNVENLTYFYQDDYNIFGKSILRYIGDGNKEKELLFRLIGTSISSSQEDFIDVSQYFMEYIENFSRIKDLKANEEVQNVSNNFFLYNFRLIPTSCILLQMLSKVKQQQQQINQKEKKIEKENNNQFIFFKVDSTETSKDEKTNEIRIQENIVSELHFKGLFVKTSELNNLVIDIIKQR